MVTCEISDKNVARIIFDDEGEKHNILKTPVMEAFEEVLDSLEEEKRLETLEGVVIASGKENSFIAGADIGEIRDIGDTEEALSKAGRGQELCLRLHRLPVPTAALINGICLGGGFELALWCDYRFVTEEGDVEMGLPEVTLGIIPGFGGTQILPRRAGLRSALDLILSGKTISGEEAVERGIAEPSIPAGFAFDIIEDFLLSAGGEKGRGGKRGGRKTAGGYLFAGNPLGRAVVFSRAKKKVLAKTGGNYPAPLKALEVLKKTRSMVLERGLEVERRGFSDLAVSETARNLIRIYFERERLKKYVPPAEDAIPLPLNRAGVVGAGVMGGGIAWLFTHKEIPVRMKDIDWDALAAGFKTIHETNQEIIAKKKIDPKAADRQESLATGATDYSGFASVPYVIEAIVEKPDLKKKVYRELEEVLPRDAVVATNTSSLTVDELAAGFKRPGRFVGMHFFNPPARMPLVEVVSGGESEDWAVAAAVRAARRLGKVPVVVGDCPGFLVNRLLMPYLNEAAYLAGEGMGIRRIDTVMKDFGWPMGPFRLMDMIGIDIGVEVAKVLAGAYGKRMEVAPLFTRVGEEEGLLGKKSGEGFYLYGGKRGELNPRIRDFLSGIIPSGNKKRPAKEDSRGEAVRMRLMLPMLFEAVRALDEGIASSADDTDIALVLGTGFPPFRGGLFRWAATIGSGAFLEYAEGIRNDDRTGGNAEARFTPPESFAGRIDSTGP